jgi:hypothetical protein
MFRTTDKRLFEFLCGRGHHNWRVRLEGGAYVATFQDTPQLRVDLAAFGNGQRSDTKTIRTLDELAEVLTR